MKNLRNSLGLHVFILLGLCISAADLMAAQFTLPPLNPDKGRIFFYRDNSYGGGAVRPSIYLNNKVVGKSIPGAFFFIDQDPGPQLVSTTTEVENKVDFTILPGQTKFVRTSVAMGFAVGRVTPEVVENSIAANEIAEKTNFGPAVKKGAINTISNCSFKTQLQFLDGTKGCLENIPLAYEKASPSDDSILDTVLRSGNYAIARSKSNLCKAFGFAGDSGVNGGVKPASERVIDACNDLGCDCELIISGGGVLVSKDELIGKQASSEINLLAPITASPSVNKTSEETQNSKISSQPINQEFKKPILIYKPDLAPWYPSFSKREKEEGDVEVKLYVGEDGKVSDVTLIKETPYLRLNRAGIEVSKQYRFTPLLVDGKPTKFVTNLLIKFRLNSGDSASALSPPFVEAKKLDILFQPNANDYYPKISLNENEEGDVIAKLIINQEGVVEEVYYLEVTNYTRLNNAALEIGKAYKFKPYLVDGKAVKVSTNVLIKFRITDDDEKSTAKPSKISNDASVRLKKLKELLDNKLITQKDYDAKKAEVLKLL